MAAIRATFTTRDGGISVGPFAARNLASHVGDDPDAVAANRRGLTVEMHATRTVFMRQVHGSDVAVVDARSPGDVADVDALVTDVPGVALSVLVADCVPVVIAGSRAAAVVHAGRRGVQQGIVTAAIAALRELDDGPLRARLGPSVCGGCYEVPAAMQEEVAALVPAARATTRAGTSGLDLPAGVTAQLRAAGVTAVHASETCTVEDPSYFSYRRDGVTGRFAGVVMIES
ncbi:MAG TPA: peptidoglycan editing factor PgeF [Mycobacteriales bacterium]|nr:peptidoglycan editing factor PgeF [Mycobacteriales bacterium]